MAQVVTDTGPALAQNLIPAAGAPINNIQLTHVGIPGPLVLIGSASFSNTAAGENFVLELWRNGATIGAGYAQATASAATNRVQATLHAAIPESLPGDVYTMQVYGSAGTASLAPNSAQLTMIGLPAHHSLAPQALATP